jgi:chain length determinant protein (polysaccharide antigen chain regulator)
MNAKHPTQTESHKIEHYEDEIELIDILRVIWKWKYLIIGGAIVCGLFAAITSFNMSKIYRIDMTLQPGIVGIAQRGDKIYIDSVENIKTIIQTNVLQNEIIKHLKKDDLKNPSNSLRFKVSTPKKSEIIKISYESASTDFGINVMKTLYQALRKKYDELVKYYQDNYDKEIQIVKAEFDILEAESISYEQGIKSIQKRIKELESLINDIENKNRILIRQRNEIVQKKENGEKNLSVVLYNNTIQQNLSLANQYRNDIQEYLFRVEEKHIKSKESSYRKQALLKNIRMLEHDKDFVQNIKILQPPTATAQPIKPKKILIIVLTTFLGLFLMLFLSFFLEFVSRHKQKGLSNGD